MGKRSKKLVRNRSKPHKKSVRATRTKKLRARARGLHPASKKRRVRAARRKQR